MHDVEALEERLQTVKWTITAPARRNVIPHASRVVARTAGLLGKRFPPGTLYERRMRRTWAERLRRLKSSS
jgi:hypothetical protein